MTRTGQHCQHQPQGERRVRRVSLPKSLWGNHSSCSAQHCCQCNTANSCFGFCRCLYKISHPWSVLLFSVWFESSNYWFSPGSKDSVKKTNVGWANVAETPQKVHKLFTKLARTSIFYHSAWKQLACFPISSGGYCTALSLILQQGPFEATDWHVFSVYFLIKENHMY